MDGRKPEDQHQSHTCPLGPRVVYALVVQSFGSGIDMEFGRSVAHVHPFLTVTLTEAATTLLARYGGWAISGNPWLDADTVALSWWLRDQVTGFLMPSLLSL